MEAKRDLADLLAGTRMFRSLNRQLLGLIAAEMREIRLDAGQPIFARGDPGNEVFLVVEGRVRISFMTPDGRKLSFAHATVGEIFGEVAAIDGSARSADATTITRVRMMSLGATALHRLLASNPAIARAVISYLCGRIREAPALGPLVLRQDADADLH